MSTLEIITNLIATCSILLAAKNNILTWPVGIVGCCLMAVLSYQNQLYADSSLQLFFIITSLIGWWQWQQGGDYDEITLSKPIELYLALPIGVLAAAVYGAVLYAFTNAYAPFIDASVFAFSVIAQLLLMKRRLQTWYFWLLVNTIAVPLFFSRGLYITAANYLYYWFLVFFAWQSWRKTLKIQHTLTAQYKHTASS